MDNSTWWKEAIVYQIYPRSFKDSNRDGVGDLPGIIEKLYYIQELGCTAVWLNPVYVSPNKDGGYDISDFCNIQSEFGTLADFDKLISGLHQRGIRLIMDIVVNHSSDQHAWFSQSRSSKDNPYRDYYFWRPGKNGGPPNNWSSFFGGSAWSLDPGTNEYYLHLFSAAQPDLNWENPELRKEVQKIMKFWLDKGVDGLRLDVISAISKQTSFPDADTSDFNEIIRRYYANGPRLREFIREMREAVWSKYDMMTVGEGPGITAENALSLLDPDEGLDMIFHFGHMFLDQGPGGRFDPRSWTIREFKDVFEKWNNAFSRQGWGSVFLGNHDFARMVSRWGDDQAHWEKSSKLLGTLLMTMPGTPFIFQGDEIGMTNCVLSSIDESRDVETLNGWIKFREQGLTEEAFLQLANYAGRDNARTPMQWTSGEHAGFSESMPWMKVNENHTRINVEVQRNDGTSVWSYFRQLIALRKSSKCLTYGSYQSTKTSDDYLYVYHRFLGKEKVLICLNFSAENINLPDDLLPEGRQLLICNYEDREYGTIRPWEALVFSV